MNGGIINSITRLHFGAMKIKVVQDCTLQRAALPRDACHFVCPWLFNLCTHKKLEDLVLLEAGQ